MRDPATGETVKDKDGKAIYDYGDNANLGYARPYAARANPAGVLDYDVNRITLDNVIGSTFPEAKLYDGLSVKGAFDVNTTYKYGAFLTNPTYGDGASYNGYIEQEHERYLSYLNVRNVSVGYTLPASALKVLGVNKVRIFAAGDNPAFFSKRQGLDPRQYDYGSTGFNYSPIRTISFGLNVTL